MSNANETNVVSTEKMEVFGNTFDIYGTINKPLFLAIDIAAMIEYSTDKVHQMLELVDEDEKLTDTIYRAGQNREMWFLTENGLYELLMQSRKPLARAFKTEVKKILNQIRIGKNRTNSMLLKTNNLMIENARLIFKNFSGEETKFNRAGDRNFCVVIDDIDMAQKLIEDGWNVKILAPREEGDKPVYYLPVAVNYAHRPPNIFLVTRHTKTPLNEETISTLDFAELEKVDLTINPYNWSANGKEGTKAYLKTLYATIIEDEFAEKYADVANN